MTLASSNSGTSASAVEEALFLLAKRDEPSQFLDLINRLSADGNALEWPDVIELLDSHQQILSKLRELVGQWDNQAQVEESWTQDSQPCTSGRRDTIMALLGASPEFGSYLKDKKPVPEPWVTIVAKPSSRVWYTAGRQNERPTYWNAYREYLIEKKGWEEAAVDGIGASSSSVLERLADPREIKPQQTKGLVVGYVQSGKTANFAAVISKAIDAGYRLIIVLTGMQNLLRKQTQRRLDMEVVGVKNILKNMPEYKAAGTPQGEYLDDEEWETGFSRILSDEAKPSIRRLTSYSYDVVKQIYPSLDFSEYKSTDAYLEGMEKESVRLVVTKKNASVLKKLNDAIRFNEEALRNVPTLLIDDESDQATPNTEKPNFVDPDLQKHKKINSQIIEMMSMLHRCQYVGYTATPFANVLINVNDDEELFPRDFILALQKPAGYMGAQSFVGDDESDLTSDAHPHPLVRYIKDADGSLGVQDRELSSALALYVVSGCIKLYRASLDPGLKKAFRHHTMLVHTSHTKAGHQVETERIQYLWQSCNWLGQAAEALLREAFADLQGTMAADSSMPVPSKFEDIRPFLRNCVEKIESPIGNEAAGQVSIVVNSEKQEAELDFTRVPTWKIVIGGNKLSRGFTVEGLTTTWFMRSPTATDTMTQMARWYGFRHGYEDLVRLFLPQEMPKGNDVVNLYEAFCATALEEEAFRDQLRQYAGFGEESVVTPLDVPPLVYNYLGWMTPAAKSKMGWAKITQQGDNRWSPKLMGYSDEDLANSWPEWMKILKCLSRTSVKENGFDWYAGVIDLETLSEALRKVKWQDSFVESVKSHLNHLEHLKLEGLQEDFALFLPQLKSPEKYFDFPDLGARTFVERQRRSIGERRRFGEYTKPEELKLAEEFTEHLQSSEALASLADPRPDRGAIVAYLIPDSNRVRTLIKNKAAYADIRQQCTAEDFTVGLQFVSSRNVMNSKQQGRVFVVDRSGIGS